MTEPKLAVASGSVLYSVGRTVLLAIVTEGAVEAGIGHVMTVVPSEPTAEPLRLNVKVVAAVVVTLAPIALLTHFSTERLRVGLR